MAEKKKTIWARVVVQCASCRKKLEWNLSQVTNLESFKEKARKAAADGVTATVPCAWCSYDTKSAVWQRWLRQGCPLFEQRICGCNGCLRGGFSFWFPLPLDKAELKEDIE